MDATDLCRRSPAPDRFQAWEAAGVFLKRWKAGGEKVDELQEIDWGWLSMDGAMTKAPFGGEKNRPQPYGSGQKWEQAQSVDRRPGGAGGPGGRRSQPA